MHLPLGLVFVDMTLLSEGEENGTAFNRLLVCQTRREYVLDWTSTGFHITSNFRLIIAAQIVANFTSQPPTAWGSLTLSAKEGSVIVVQINAFPITTAAHFVLSLTRQRFSAKIGEVKRNCHRLLASQKNMSA